MARIEDKLSLLNSNYKSITGKKFEHFFCPILMNDEQAELCKAHVVNKSFPDSSRKWTVQRADIDNFYGAMFESDFSLIKYRKLTHYEVIACKDLAKKIRPKLILNNVEIPHYYYKHGPIPKGYSPAYFDFNGERTKCVLKIEPEKLKKIMDGSWDIQIDKDWIMASIVSLLKTAHLTMFYFFMYDYCFSPGGKFLGEKILGGFYGANKNLRKQDVLINADTYFLNYMNMVRPIRTGTGLYGSIFDNKFHFCYDENNNIWGIIVYVKCSDMLSSVLLPFSHKKEIPQKYIRFLYCRSLAIEIRDVNYIDCIWNIGPKRNIVWPMAEY